MNMPAWTGRALALALLVAVIAFVYYVMLVPLRQSYAETDQKIAEARELLARYERLAAGRLRLVIATLVARKPFFGTTR